MKQYTFVLNFGYVESSGLSYMPFTSTGKYKDAKEALVDLAKFLKEQYLVQYENKPKKCCLAAKNKDPAPVWRRPAGASWIVLSWKESSKAWRSGVTTGAARIPTSASFGGEIGRAHV